MLRDLLWHDLSLTNKISRSWTKQKSEFFRFGFGSTTNCDLLVQHLHADDAALGQKRARLLSPSVALRRGCWCRRTRSPFVRLVTIEAVVGGEGPLARAHVFQRLLSTPALLHHDLTLCGAHDVDFVADLEAHFLDELLGKPDREAVASFRNLHDCLRDILQ